MAGPNGGVWGNEVIVPEGEKLSAATAAHVKPAGGDENNTSGDENNTGGDDTKNTSPTEPVVRLPDGTEVPVGDYDPFAKQRQDLEHREQRVDGMMTVINNGNGNPPTGDQEDKNTGDPPPEHPLLAENPLLQKIEVSDEDGLFNDDQKAFAEQHNNLVDYTKQQNQQYVEAITALKDEHKREIDAIKETVGDRFVREDIARVTAMTGVSEQDLLAASKATGVTDVQTLAEVVAGQKAIQAANAEAEAAAEAKRTEDAGSIGGASQGGNNGGGTQKEEGRGVKDWRDPQSVGAAYKFGATG